MLLLEFCTLEFTENDGFEEKMSNLIAWIS